MAISTMKIGVLDYPSIDFSASYSTNFSHHLPDTKA
jgi:hypothetical protein